MKYTTESWIQKAKELNGGNYDYSKVQYISYKEKVCIICPIHGEFWQKPASHLEGHGCPKCAGNSRHTKETFIEGAIKVHGGKYDYSKVVYKNNATNVLIVCPEHGEFKQTPNMHLGGRGCPYCHCSHGETFIHNWLTSNNFKFASQHELYLPTSGKSVVRVDFWITYKDKIYAIEYNGKQHYQFCSIFHKDEFALLAQQQRDNALQDYCDSNKIKLLWVKYDLTFPQVESELRNFFGVEA